MPLRKSRRSSNQAVITNTPSAMPSMGYSPGTSSIAVYPSLPETPRPVLVDPQVEQYYVWLQQNNAVTVPDAVIQTYKNAALEIKQIGSQSVCTFAPFEEERSAFHVFTKRQIIALVLLLILWIAGLLVLHLKMVSATIGAITLLYIFGFLTSSILVTNSSRKKSGEWIEEKIIHSLDQLGAEWPTYTILCPLFQEVAVVPQFVEAIRSLNYPAEKLQVLFLTEQSDAQTRMALEQMRLPANFTILTVPQGTPQTKSRACNFGLLHAKGQFVVIFDAEDKPEPLQLKKAVLTFANHGPETACVQAKLNYYNPKQNLLTRWFTAEYSTWFDIMLPGLQRTGISLPLGGTSNHFRTEILRALGGWDAFNVAEDCELGLRISQHRLKTAVVDSTTYEEATSQVKAWLYQRSRWIKGYFQTYLVHMRHPLQMLKKQPIGSILSLQMIVGAWTFVLLLNPIMQALTICYFLFSPTQLYQSLFPSPILYMATFCLIFGNFSYIYIHLLGCLRRKEYALMKWILLIPIYWCLMSIAAYIAIYELIVKPHYWRKTPHGRHLTHAAQQVYVNLPDERECKQPVVASMSTRDLALPNTLRTTMQQVEAIRSDLTARLDQHTVQQLFQFPLQINYWLIALLSLTIGISICSTWYSFVHHDILLYRDAYSHMLIARSVIDNVSPGFAQLGGVWLPLPHLLMLPLIWNDFLWQTGLAGSIPSMICYVVTTAFLFLSAKLLTKSNIASFIGTLVFVLNPNIIYLQTTPLSECVSFATIAITGYFFILWAQSGKNIFLILTGIATFFAGFTRFDGWYLSGIIFLLVGIICLLRRHQWKQIEAQLLLFGLLGGFAIILWLLWNQIIFGSPIYFLTSVYSSKAHTLVDFQKKQSLATIHNILISIQYYVLACIDNIGKITCILGLAAFAKFVIRRERFPEMIASLCYFAPVFFYIFAFYTGNVNILIPGVSSQIYNARFGSAVALPASIFIATSMCVGIRLPKIPLQICMHILVGGAIILQYLIIMQNGIIVLEDGQYGLSCEPPHAVNVYLAQHYNGHLILEDTYAISPNESQEVGIHVQNIISSGSNTLWKRAIKDPTSFALLDWVIISKRRPHSPYPIQVHLNTSSFQSHFRLVAHEDNFDLYQRKSIKLPPTRPIPQSLLVDHQHCDTGKYPLKGQW